MTTSTDLARTVVTALLQAGVTDVVIAPGSRNAPLSFAVFDAAGAGALRLHTRIDERTAAFLALGLAKVSGRPAAVICTSGTAVANFHPAALEAAHSGVPLVLVTADRPASLRGTSANQTTDQVRIIPGLDFLDVAEPDQREEIDEHLTALDMPLHLNVQLADPLVPAESWQVPVIVRRDRRREHHHEAEIPHGPRTVVVAGDDAGPAARVLAQRGQWPLFAEPTSGSRTGTHALRTYRLLLDGDLGARIERVVVAGHPTLSRPISRLLAREDVEIWDMEGRGLWRERPFAVDHAVARATTAESIDTSWFDQWVAADRSVGRQLDALLRSEADLTPYAVAGAVSRAVPPEGMLWVGASSPIRDLDLMVARYDVGDRRKVIANRGLAGIDGTISSAIGATLGRPRTSRALALMGDVTFLHDTTGLILGPAELRPDLTIVVVNDNGGAIFSMLEQGAPEYAESYDALFGTPHDVDIASLCAATRTPHLRVTTLPELEQALATPNGGIEVVEAVVRRDNRRELDARIRALRA